MDYAIQKKGNSNTGRYEKTDLDLAYQFSKAAYKEFQPILKGIVLFGSNARHQAKPQSDIDILIVVDDVTMDLSKELMETYKVISEKIIQKVSNRIHVTTIRYSTFFEYARNGDPIVINILRDGVALVDTGFFDPLQALLVQGRIRPTSESIWAYFNRAPNTLHNSRWHLMRACEDLYWAVTDAAHAVLMKQGCVPPSPEGLPELLNQHLVSKKMLDKKYVHTVKMFYDLYKAINRRELKDVSGTMYEKYFEHAKEFVHACEKLLK